MNVPDDRPSLAEDIAALDRIIERLRWFDQGFGEDVLLRVLSILQQHERLTADLTAANERIARLEEVLETAARFHGIDVDALCEPRVEAEKERCATIAEGCFHMAPFEIARRIRAS